MSSPLPPALIVLLKGVYRAAEDPSAMLDAITTASLDLCIAELNARRWPEDDKAVA